MMKTLRLLFPALLTGCAASLVSGPVDDVSRQINGDLYEKSSPAVSTTTGIKVPILRSPELEAWYGKPTYHIMADGSYISCINAGARSLTITGTNRQVSESGLSRPGDTVTILGRKIGYHDSSNDTGAITTDPIRLTAPDGKSATYVVTVENNTDSTLPNLPLLGW